jgi:hypothetical protein
MIKDHYYQQKSRQIESNLKAILALGTDHERQFNERQIQAARSTMTELERRYGYDEVSARECVKFLMLCKESNPPASR